MVPLFDTVILWAHLFSAVLFVGGSFFMWLVVMPASYLITEDESERTLIVGKIAKSFGRLTNPILVVLILTGLYNATWYLPSASALLGTGAGLLLLSKSVLVAVLVALIYAHNVYFGRKIVRLAREGKLDELKALRKKSRIVSFANLGLMVVILALVAVMQMSP
ncbi:MAG: CopD family protein [Nitrososphaerales archaeon]|nr:CopD family protein [Nitrososphaerales archaeon]